MRRWAAALAIHAAALCCCSALAIAEDAVSFAGKRISVIIPGPSGGSFDAYSRLVGTFLAQHLPGAPHLLPVNMPGGDGIIGLNNFVLRSKPDGLTIATGYAVASDPLFLRSVNAVYDLTKFAFIGGGGHPGRLVVISKAAMPRLLDQQAAPATIGSIAGLRGGMYGLLWGTEYLGWHTKWVLGYPSSRAVQLAMENGEIDMSAFGAAKIGHVLVDTGKFEILAQTGHRENGVRVPRAEFPAAPLLPDLVQQQISDDPRARAAFAYWEQIEQVGTWTSLPPGTPQPIVAAYRRAMAEIVADPGFQEKIAQVVPDGFIAMTGEEVKALMDGLARTPPEVLTYLDELEKKQGVHP